MSWDHGYRFQITTETGPKDATAETWLRVRICQAMGAWWYTKHESLPLDELWEKFADELRLNDDIWVSACGA